MGVGRYNRLVAVSRAPQTTPDSDGYFEALTPATWWCSITPLDASVSDSTRLQMSRVEGRFHPQITVDTRLMFTDASLGRDRELFVKGVQNLNDANTTMVLFAEEVVP